MIIRGELMEDLQITQRIFEAREGNEIARQKIIIQYKPYIINVISHICKRFITWNDEEASIGLMAFNKAIDTYESTKGRTFQSYAYFIINRDLINYFQKNKKDSQILSLDYISEENDSTISVIEMEKSLEYYDEKVQSDELVQEILELEQVISDYGIQFEELEYSSPKHKDTKKILNDMIRIFLQDKGLVDEFIKKRRFPAAVFVKETGYPLKTIERYRKYLITVIIIMLHPDWTHLLTYVCKKRERRG